MNQEQVNDFLLQALEHERCGVQVYEAALQCVRNDDLREEFRKYLGQTQNHAKILLEICMELDIAPDTETPGRGVVRMMGQSLVQAMQKAKAGGNPEAAEIVACECVVLAESKDHLNWELIGQIADNFKREGAQTLEDAYDEVEDQEDEHLYHSRGWCRELWMQCLGMKAVLPPPEERQHVKTGVQAARVQQARTGK